MANEIVKYESADGQEVTFTAQDVKERLCSKMTDQDLAFTMALCQSQKLNPFTKDVHIIKYGDNPAQVITSKEVFTKRAQANPKFEGMEAGVTFLTPDGKIIQRDGSMPINGWTLIGGWCKVYVKGYRVPIYDEVALSEYSTGKSNWAKMPGTMIRKVALCHALREAFPDDFQGLYGAEEMGEVGQVVNESKDTTSNAEKTALNDESVDVIATFEDVVSEEQAQEYVETCNEFGELVGKDFNDVHAALMNTKVMQKCEAGDDYENWSKVTMIQALCQLDVWIEKAKASKPEPEVVQPELADEDIHF